MKLSEIKIGDKYTNSIGEMLTIESNPIGGFRCLINRVSGSYRIFYGYNYLLKSLSGDEWIPLNQCKMEENKKKTKLVCITKEDIVIGAKFKTINGCTIEVICVDLKPTCSQKGQTIGYLVEAMFNKEIDSISEGHAINTWFKEVEVREHWINIKHDNSFVFDRKIHSSSSEAHGHLPPYLVKSYKQVQLNVE